MHQAGRHDTGDVEQHQDKQDFGSGFAIKLKTGVPFNGREALERQAAAGLRRRLVHLKLSDPGVFPLGDEPILQDDRVVGQVTSAAFGHTLGTGVAIGYIALDGRGPKEAVQAGGFQIEQAGNRHAADASLTPLFDPRGERLRREA